MRTYQNLLGAAALGATVALFGFAMPQQASAAACSNSDPGSGGTCGTFIETRGTDYNTPADILSWAQDVWTGDDSLLVFAGKFDVNPEDGSGSVVVINDAGNAIGIGGQQGTWTSTVPILYYAIWGGSDGALYKYDTPQTSGTWNTSYLTAGASTNQPGLSGFGGVQVVPVPAALPLLLTALGVIGVIGRKKMKAAA